MAKIPTAQLPGGIPLPSGVPVGQGARGFRVNVPGTVMNAVGAPMIDVRSAVGAELSGAKVGEAVNSFGATMGRIAEAQLKVINQRKVGEAELALTQASNQLAVSLAETDDETQWTDITGKHIEGVRKALLDDAKLSPVARAEIERRVGLWGTRMQGEAAIYSFDRSRKKAADVLSAGYLMALEAGDYRKAAEGIDALRLGGHIDDTKATQLRLNVTAKRREDVDLQADTLITSGQADAARELYDQAGDLFNQTELQNRKAKVEFGAMRNQQLGEIGEMELTDPTKGLEMLKAGEWPNVTGEDRAKAAMQFGRTAEYLAAQEVDSAKQAVALLPADRLESATVDSLGVELKQATPFHRFVIETLIKDRRQKDPAILAQKQDSLFQSLYATAGAWKQQDDPLKEELAASRFEMLADTLPPEMKQRLVERRNAAVGEGPDRDGVGVTGPAIAEAHEAAIAGGAFGDVTRPVLSPDGKPLFRDPKTVGKTGRETKTLLGFDALWPDAGARDVVENEGKPVPLTEEDPVRKAEAERKFRMAKDQLEREAKLPKNKDWTPDDARLRMYEILHGMGAKITAPTRVEPLSGPPALPMSGSLPDARAGELGPNPILPPMTAEQMRIFTSDILKK